MQGDVKEDDDDVDDVDDDSDNEDGDEVDAGTTKAVAINVGEQVVVVDADDDVLVVVITMNVTQRKDDITYKRLPLSLDEEFLRWDAMMDYFLFF